MAKAGSAVWARRNASAAVVIFEIVEEGHPGSEIGLRRGRTRVGEVDAAETAGSDGRRAGEQQDKCECGNRHRNLPPGTTCAGVGQNAATILLCLRRPDGGRLESGMPIPCPDRSPARAALLVAGALAAALLLQISGSPLAATAANVLPSVYEPAGTGGFAALDRALAKLETHRRLLVIGAHPDDEDTSALALVSRELGGEAAYLSMSRGEGGQNLIGPDLGEALGVLRTEELLAARGIDGARQYFTRAFDFGYTRSLPETLGKWPEEILLADTVRVIRRFKPQVILSVFGNDGSGGHGQHQAAGHAAFLAFARSAEALPGRRRRPRAGRAVEGPGALSRRLVLARECDGVAVARRHRSVERSVDPADRDEVAQPAPLAGHGAASRARATRRQVHLRRGPGRCRRQVICSPASTPPSPVSLRRSGRAHWEAKCEAHLGAGVCRGRTRRAAFCARTGWRMRSAPLVLALAELDAARAACVRSERARGAAGRRSHRREDRHRRAGPAGRERRRARRLRRGP